MIELIFAIVIIGIVLMSVPNLIQTAEKSGYVAIQQESINEAAAHLSIIMGYHWDENDTDERFLDPVLHVTNGDTGLNESPAGSGRRSGTPKESFRKFIRADGNNTLYASTSLGLDSGESRGDEDDIDDFNNESYHLTEIEAAAADYIDSIEINSTLRYASDTPGSGTYSDPGTDGKITYSFDTSGTPTTNVKEITVTLTSSSGTSELDKNITFKAFSCNIGAIELGERHF